MLKKLGFQKRIYLYYSLFVILVVIFLTIIFYYYISSVLMTNASNEMTQILNKISSNLDYHVKEADTLISQVLFSKDLQEIMTNTPQFRMDDMNYFDSNYDSASKARAILTAINSPNVTVRRLTIFNETGSYVSVGKVGVSALGHKDAYSSISENIGDGKHLVIIPPHYDPWLIYKESSMVLSYARDFRATYNYSDHIGYIEVQQLYSDIENICRTNYKSNINVLIINDNGNVIYPLNRYKNDEISYYISLKSSNGNIHSRPWDKVDELVYGFHSSYTGWNIILTQPKRDFMSPINFLQELLIVTGVIFALATLIIIYIISRRLTFPLRELRNLVKKLTLENLSIHLSDETENDEVALLNEAFSKALFRLQESINQVIQAKAGEDHAHLLALQAQINPHFIYNTLMGISAVGEDAGSREVVMMCSQLADMLRYTASFRSEIILLANEIKHAENYIKLTKWRYGERLTYNIDIPNEMLEIKCPKLILQPLVENCFYHAFRNSRPPYEVNIKGHTDKNNWFIEVEDNGCGFPENEIEKIFQRVESYKKDASCGKIFEKLEVGGLGIINIYMRLNLLYKESAVFEVISAPNGGSKVRIGGLINDKGFYC